VPISSLVRARFFFPPRQGFRRVKVGCFSLRVAHALPPPPPPRKFFFFRRRRTLLSNREKEFFVHALSPSLLRKMPVLFSDPLLFPPPFQGKRIRRFGFSSGSRVLDSSGLFLFPPPFPVRDRIGESVFFKDSSRRLTRFHFRLSFPRYRFFSSSRSRSFSTKTKTLLRLFLSSSHEAYPGASKPLRAATFPFPGIRMRYSGHPF